MFFQLIILALSLSIDGLGIGFAYGMRNIKVPFLARLIVFSISLIFSGIAVLVGVQLSKFIGDDILKIVGVLILISLGGYIILDNFKNEEKYDMNNSKVIEPFEALYLGSALSLDSIGAGIACVAFGFNAFTTPIVIAATQTLFLAVGIIAGKKLTGLKFRRSVLSISSGIIIIILGLLRLL